MCAVISKVDQLSPAVTQPFIHSPPPPLHWCVRSGFYTLAGTGFVQSVHSTDDSLPSPPLNVRCARQHQHQNRHSNVCLQLRLISVCVRVFCCLFVGPGSKKSWPPHHLSRSRQLQHQHQQLPNCDWQVCVAVCCLGAVVVAVLVSFALLCRRWRQVVHAVSYQLSFLPSFFSSSPPPPPSSPSPSPQSPSFRV